MVISLVMEHPADGRPVDAIEGRKSSADEVVDPSGIVMSEQLRRSHGSKGKRYE